MSNRVNIDEVEIKFTKSGVVTRGYVISDDYGSSYGEGYESPFINDQDLFNAICENNESASDLIECALEHGADINGTWYDGEELMRWRSNEYT